MSFEREQEFLEKAFKMQCRFVGIKYKKKEFKELGFWQKHSWSHREEERFRRWFVREIRKDLKMSNASANMEWLLYSLAYCWDYRKPPQND